MTTGVVAATPRPLLLVTLDGPQGQREVEAHDLRFVYFTVRYRQRMAGADEGPAGERTDVVGDRKECQCLRMPDWSKIKLMQLRSIEITHAAGSRFSMVRVTRRDGQMNEYPATSLYGGDGLYPPFFSMTIEGERRDFPLVLAGRPDLDWPGENLVRILWTTTTPPPKSQRPAH